MKYKNNKSISLLFSINWLQIMVATILLTIFGFLVFYVKENNNYDVNRGVTVFFELWSINRSVIFISAFLLVLPVVICSKYYSIYENGFYKSILSRIGYNKYMILSLKNVFLNSLIFIIVLNISLLFMIHVFYSNVSLEPQRMFFVFSEDTFLNVGMYLIFSTLGTCIYSLFLVIIIPLFSNKYAYYAFPVLFTLASIFIGLLTTFLFLPLMAILKATTVRALGFFLSPIFLITPGIMFEEQGLTNVIISYTTYLIVFLIAYLIVKRRVSYNE